MQLMMIQREIDSEAERRRYEADKRMMEAERVRCEADERMRETEELWHRQIVDVLLMMSMMTNTQRSQSQYLAQPPLNNY